MMKILVPTDFSKLSRVGANYAIQLAKKIGAEVVLFHVAHFETPPLTHMMSIADVIKENVFQDLTDRCLQLKKELQVMAPEVSITSQVVDGGPLEDQIESYAKLHGIDWIVMGTKGASGLQKMIFGSQAYAVINKSSLPVILIPEHARFKDWENIVYASDLMHPQEELKKLIPLARLFHARIHLLHVLSPDSKQPWDVVKLQNALIQACQYEKINLQVSHHYEVMEEIDDFIADQQAELVVLFTHEFTFFEKIFKKSLTREIAFHTWVPLLSMKKAH